MAFAKHQLRLLDAKLPEKHVKSRVQRGMTLSYIEGWHAIAEANRIFGFDGWDRETVAAECVWQDGRSATKLCAYTAKVRIRVRAGETIIQRDGSGVGQGSGSTLGEAHESALKEAETDATKRALTTRYISTHKDETVAIESRLTHYAPSIVAKEYDIDRGMFTKDCRFDAESLTNLARSFVELNLLPKPPDMSKLYTAEYIPHG